MVGCTKNLIFISLHGKQDKISTPSTKPECERNSIIVDVLALIKELNVPKRYFTHFYFIGILTSIFILLTNIDGHFCLLPILLFSFHALRRLLECVSITIFGTSRMNIGGYLVGISHYVLAPFSCTFINCGGSFQTRLLFPIVLFLVANQEQFKIHYTLFRIKRDSKSRDSKSRIVGDKQNHYQIPRGGWFKYVCCPHYSAEILIYLSFYLLDPSCKVTFFMLCWVISNLAVVSNQQFLWYDNNFTAVDYPSLKSWKRLLPYVY